MADAGGIVAILFTDLVGSTTMYDRLGDVEAERLRREHFALLRDVVERSGGTEVKSVGDGLMVVYPSAVAAVEAALDIQSDANARNRGSVGQPLEVRVGVNVGEPLREDEDFFGISVNVSRRLCDAATAGQTLTSDVVRALTEPRLRSQGVTFRSVGDLHLKGIEDPVAGYDVTRPDPSPTTSAVELTLPPLVAGASREATFSGRAAELDAATSAWKQAVAGTRRVLLVSGEPGIGKTRLAVELARRATEDGAVVLAGRCDAELSTPFHPLTEAFGHLVDGLGVARLRDDAAAADAAAVVPSLAGGPGTVTAVDNPRLFRALGHLLALAGEVGPVLLLLDDAHWADHGTLLFVRHLLRATPAHGLLLVITYRDTDLARTHPLAALLGDVRREPGVERVALGGVTAADVLEMLGASGDAGAGGVDAGDPEFPALVDRVTAETEGNPFFVLEVFRHLLDAQAIVHDDDGAWRVVVAPTRIDVPEGVREVVGRRLTQLSDGADAFLGAAAVLGRAFTLADAANVAGVTVDDALAHLDEAVRAHLVDEVPGPGATFAFAHGLVRETLDSELTSARRLRLHLRAADVLQARGAPPAEVAHHRLEAGPAGDVVQAAAWALCAAWISRELLVAPWDGRRFAERGLDVLDGVDAPELRADLEFQRADAAVTLSRFGDAEVLLTALVDDALRRDDGWRATRAIVSIARGLGSVLPSGAPLGPLLERVRERFASTSPLIALRLDAAAAFSTSHVGEVELDRATAVVEAAERLHDPEAATYGWLAWADAMLSRPEPHRVRSTLEEGMARAAVWTPFVFLPFSIRLMAACMCQGDRAAIDGLLERAEDERFQQVGGWTTHMRMHAMTIALFEGDVDRAAEVASDELQRGLTTLAWAGPVLAMAAQERDEATSFAPLLEAEADRSDEPVWRAGSARFHAQAGDTERAQALASGLLDAFDRRWTFSAGMVLLSDVAVEVGDTDLAAGVFERLLPWSGLGTIGGYTVFTGAADRALGRCALLLGDVDRACDLLERAERFEAGMRFGLLEAHAAVDRAAALRRRDLPGDAEVADELVARATRFADERRLPYLRRRAAG